MKVLFLLPLLALSRPLPPSVPAPPRPLLRPTAAPDSTTVRVIYGADDPELYEVLSRVLNVEKHRLAIHDPRLAGRLFHLTYQEFRQGRAAPEKELAGQPARLMKFDTTGTFACTVYARRATAATVENSFLFPGGMVRKSFAADPAHAGQYSLRTDIHRLRRAADQSGRSASSPAQEFRLPLSGKVPFLVYTLPYESEGSLLYCSLAQSRVPVGEWYQQFRIPHFVVYYARVE